MIYILENKFEALLRLCLYYKNAKLCTFWYINVHILLGRQNRISVNIPRDTPDTIGKNGQTTFSGQFFAN